ncbi:MAG TPA: amino-acid N-acetyltransferase [Gammaproteobacteria bacterium]|nr:amino-acid N-acetyltransferase [Gammaproteobacteria bacterium]
MTQEIPVAEFVKWFRDSSPYINAHRGRTFVLAIDGDTLRSPEATGLVHDIALLASLGVRLVLVHGAEPQIEARLAERGLELDRVNGFPVVDPGALACAREAVGALRIDIEARFSTGLSGTPMAGNAIRLVSGNLVVARPIGVRDGIDYLHSGEVRRVRTGAIRDLLGDGALVLLSPVACSPTGEAFLLDAADVATAAAIQLQADKLLFVSGEPPLRDAADERIGELTPGEAQALCGKRSCSDGLRLQIRHAVRACRGGVARAHLLSSRHEGALLQELYTRDGVGTLITSEHYDTLRDATIDDVGGVLQIIAPLEQEGILVHRSREQLELEIDNFVVMERDGMIIACAALYEFPPERAAELACVGVHPDYRNADRGVTLLRHLEKRARSRGIERLIVLTTRTSHWFREQGFEPARIQDLPVSRQAMYNYQRNSKVFIKALG